MSMPAPAIPPDAGAFLPHVMEPLHAELALAHLGALVGMAGTMVDFLTEKGLAFEEADGQAQAALRRSLAEGPDLLAMLTGRAFEAIRRGVRVRRPGPSGRRQLPRRCPPRAHHAGDPVMANLETALRRAALWARRGMPNAAAELLAGTDGVLRFRPEHGDLAARLPGGEEVRVQLSAARRRVTITRRGRRCELVGSADLPPHLVEHSG